MHVANVKSGLRYTNDKKIDSALDIENDHLNMAFEYGTNEEHS